MRTIGSTTVLAITLLGWLGTAPSGAAPGPAPAPQEATRSDSYRAGRRALEA